LSLGGSIAFPVIAGLIVGIALIVILVLCSNNFDDNTFIGKTEASNAILEKYPFLRNEMLEPKFGYLKYAGTSGEGFAAGKATLDWYAAEPSTGQVMELLHSGISVGSENGVFDENAYVWTESYFIPGSSHIIFIDAENGMIIGEWVPCPGCVCYHNGITYK